MENQPSLKVGAKVRAMQTDGNVAAGIANVEFTVTAIWPATKTDPPLVRGRTDEGVLVECPDHSVMLVD